MICVKCQMIPPRCPSLISLSPPLDELLQSNVLGPLKPSTVSSLCWAAEGPCSSFGRVGGVPVPPSDPGPQWSPPSPLLASSEWLFDQRPPGGKWNLAASSGCAKGNMRGITLGYQRAVFRKIDLH